MLHVNRRHYPAPREVNDKMLNDVNGSTFKPQFSLNLRISAQAVVFVLLFTVSMQVNNSILTKSFLCSSNSCLSLHGGIQAVKLFIDTYRLVHDSSLLLTLEKSKTCQGWFQTLEDSLIFFIPLVFAKAAVTCSNCKPPGAVSRDIVNKYL